MLIPLAYAGMSDFYLIPHCLLDIACLMRLLINLT